MLESLSWSLVVFAEAAVPMCFSSKYFHSVTHVRRESCKAYLSPLLRCTTVCLHDTFHISNKKRDGKAASVFKQREKEVCGTPACRWKAEMKNVKQMSGSSALPGMAPMRSGEG